MVPHLFQWVLDLKGKGYTVVQSLSAGEWGCQGSIGIVQFLLF